MMPFRTIGARLRLARTASCLKRATALCLALGCMACQAPPTAADTANAPAGTLRVVVVNVERLLVESGDARAAAARIDKEFAPRRQQIQQQLRQLREKSERLAQEGPNLSDREHLVRLREIGELERTIRRAQASISEDYTERHEAERAALAQRIHDIVLTLPARLGVDVVVTRTIWHRPAIDVTDKVMQLLDQ